MASSKSKVLKIVQIVLRVALGAIFIYAGWVKLQDPWQLFAAGVASYELLPMGAVEFVARTLPWFNFALFVALASVAIVVAIIFLGLTVLDRSMW